MSRPFSTGTRSPKRVKQDERRRDVARLRRNGATLEQIAQQLGISKPTVMRDLDGLLSELHGQALVDADAWRSLQLAELQRVRDLAFDAIADSLDRAAPNLTVVLKAQEREARLLGLDRPTEVSATLSLTPDEARKALDDMGAVIPETSTVDA